MLVLAETFAYKPCSVQLLALSMLLQGSESEHVGFSREMRLQTLFSQSVVRIEHVGFCREMRLQTLFSRSVSQSVVRIEHVASRFGR